VLSVFNPPLNERSPRRARRAILLLGAATAAAALSAATAGTAVAGTPPKPSTGPPALAGQLRAPANAGGQLSTRMMPAGSPDAVRRGPAVSPLFTAGPVNTQYGPDVASYQHPYGQPLDWSAIAASAQAFTIVKATEMTSGGVYVNPYLRDDLAGAESNGMTVGSYAFARPEYGAVEQADAFAAAVGTLPAGSLPPVLDLEVTGGLAPAELIRWTQTFLDRLQADTGIVPMIYTGPYFWDSAMAGSSAFTRYPLWEASYTGGPPPQAFGGWPSYTLWQFTDNATISGIGGGVDQSLLNGTRQALLSLAQPTITSSLHAPATLSGGQGLRSQSGQYLAAMQQDGNLVVYGNGRALWSTRTWGNPGGALSAQTNGSLVLYSQGGSPLWSSHSAGSGTTVLVMQDDGNLVLYSGGRAVWGSGMRGSDALDPATLRAGQYLHSPNGRYQLTQQSDGNLVVYSSGRAVWATQTFNAPGASFSLQTDGNLVVYSSNAQPLWASGTSSAPTSNRLVMQDDGNLVLYRPQGAAWASGTAGA